MVEANHRPAREHSYDPASLIRATKLLGIRSTSMVTGASLSRQRRTSRTAIQSNPRSRASTRRYLSNRLPHLHTVEVEPRLHRKSPENGNIRGSGWRLLPIWTENIRIWEFRDSGLTAKDRQQRAFLLLAGRYRQSPHCLAGDAVLIAAVSMGIPC
jgi:hypothetical protein